MTDTTAKMIAHSVSPEGIEIKSIQLRYPKFIHGELMTHRVFSRNASSSRAVPTAKLLEEARRDDLRAEPSFSVVNAPGMQGGRPTTLYEYDCLRAAWRAAAVMAADTAEAMFRLGGAKQDVNRLLEPFTHINVLVTSTEWDNFFGLRLDKDAQPEMQALAKAIWVATRESAPVLRKPGEWHLPYVTGEDYYSALKAAEQLGLKESNVLLRVSTARCARVSYFNFDAKPKRPAIVEDLALYDRLFGRDGAKHASPAEHQATPDSRCETTDIGSWFHPHEHGNLRGWRQYRKTIAGEAVASLPEEYRL